VLAQLDRRFIRVAPGRTASRLIGYTFFEGRPAATAGRWWNPVVFGNLRLAAKRANGRVDRPVFIVGMGRSGTTLLGRVLAAHPSVGFLNEPKAMWHVIRSDEDIIGSYAPPNTGRLYLGVDDVDEGVHRRAHALVGWYLRASRSKRLVDKYPELIFRHAFVRAIFPDARFVMAVRSPWSALESVVAWSKTHATGSVDWWGLRDQKWDILWTQGVVEGQHNADLAALDLGGERDHFVRAAVEWIVAMRGALMLAATESPAQIVRYEQLVERPQEVIRKTLHFCELSPSSRTEAYAAGVVSKQSHEGDRLALSRRLPGSLVSAIEETSSRLDSLSLDPPITG
jgi:Sulfotransferase family